jgi:hypothetical protein
MPNSLSSADRSVQIVPISAWPDGSDQIRHNQVMMIYSLQETMSILTYALFAGNNKDFQSKLLEVLAEELKLKDLDDQHGFNRALGATASGDYDYFNATRSGKKSAVKDVEAWQILSPLRGCLLEWAILTGRFMSTSERALWSWHQDIGIDLSLSHLAPSALSTETRSSTSTIIAEMAIRSTHSKER